MGTVVVWSLWALLCVAVMASAQDYPTTTDNSLGHSVWLVLDDPKPMYKPRETVSLTCKHDATHQDVTVRFWLDEDQLTMVHNGSSAEVATYRTGIIWCSIKIADGTVIRSANEIYITVQNVITPTVTPIYEPSFTARLELDYSSGHYRPGETARLLCTHPEQPKDAMYHLWKDAGLFAEQPNDYKFYIKNLQEEDSGLYWCSISLPMVDYVSAHSVSITVGKGIPTDPKDDKYASIYLANHASTKLNPGDTAELTCKLSKKPDKAQHQFWKGETLLATTSKYFYFIYDLREKDSGLYWCSMVTKDGKYKSTNTLDITVGSGLPNYITTQSPIYNTTSSYYLSSVLSLRNKSPKLRPGDTAHMTCTGRHMKDRNTFRFYRDDTQVAVTQTYYFFMFAVQVEDSGFYWCTIETDEGRFNSKNTLELIVDDTTTAATITTPRSVDGSAPTLILRNPLAWFYEGAGAHFYCRADGYGEDTRFELSRNGRTLTQQLGRDFYLINLQPWESGRYQCHVLLVYRRLDSHNSVYLEIRPRGTDPNEDKYSDAARKPQFCYAALVISLMLAMKGTLMGIKA